MGRRAAFPPGEAREDWAIIRALSDTLGKTLPFDTLVALRQKLVAAVPTFGAVGEKPNEAWASFGQSGQPGSEPFRLPIADFYRTDAISRASDTMAQCSALYVQGGNMGTGTHG